MEHLIYEVADLKKQVKELKATVELLMQERADKIAFDIQCLKTLKEWDEYNKAEEASQKELDSEGCRNAR